MGYEKTVWKIALFDGRKRAENAFEVRITDSARNVTRGRGRTPLEAHRAAELKLVVKPWITATEICRLEGLEEDYERLAQRCEQFESKISDIEIIVHKVLGGRLGYTDGMNAIAAFFKREEAPVKSGTKLV